MTIFQALYVAAASIKATRYPSPTKDPQLAAEQWSHALNEALLGWKLVQANEMTIREETEGWRRPEPPPSLIEAPTPEAVAATMASHT